MSVAGKLVKYKLSPLVPHNGFYYNTNTEFYKKHYRISFEYYKKYFEYVNNMKLYELEETHFKNMDKLKKYYKRNNYEYEIVYDNVSQIDKYSYVPFKIKCVCGKEIQHKNIMSHFNHKCKVNTIRNEIQKLVFLNNNCIDNMEKAIHDFNGEVFTDYTKENLEKLQEYQKVFSSIQDNLFNLREQFFIYLKNDYPKKDLNIATASFKNYYIETLDFKKYDYEILVDLVMDCEKFFSKIKSHIQHKIKHKIKEIKENIDLFVNNCECNICLDMKKCREVDCCKKPICKDCETGIKQANYQSKDCPYCRNKNW